MDWIYSVLMKVLEHFISKLGQLSKWSRPVFICIISLKCLCHQNSSLSYFIYIPDESGTTFSTLKHRVLWTFNPLLQGDAKYEQPILCLWTSHIDYNQLCFLHCSPLPVVFRSGRQIFQPAGSRGRSFLMGFIKFDFWSVLFDGFYMIRFLGRLFYFRAVGIFKSAGPLGRQFFL